MTVVDEPIEVPEVELPEFVEGLSEEEVYLACLLMDEAGLDQAEFLWTDPTKPDGCYRAYPYQWAWWRCRDERQIDASARSTGKSERIISRLLAFPGIYPQQEMALIAPEHSHIATTSERAEARIYATRFYTEMVRPGTHGVTHKPFQVMWANGSRLLSRLPQKSGLGVKSLHPIVLEVDEAQDIPKRAWAEMPEVVRWDVPGAKWLCHGVSKGIRDEFFHFSQEGSGFTVHKIMALDKPARRLVNGRLADDPALFAQERLQKIKEYGGHKDSPDFRRNFYGVHGEAMNRIFMLSRLMAVTDSDEASPYNTEEYFYREITVEEVLERAREKDGRIEYSSEAQAAAIAEMLDFPALHKAKYSLFWAGMDFGLVGDPSEILVFAEYVPTAKELAADRAAGLATPDAGQTRLKLITRIRIKEIPEPLQDELIMHVIDFYRPKAFCLDITGSGLPAFQRLQQRAGTSRFVTIDYTKDEPTAVEDRAKAKQALTMIKGYNFGAKVVVAINEAEAEALGPNATPQEIAEKAGIKRYVKDAATDMLRELVDMRRAMFPSDEDITNDLNAQTWSYSQEPVDAYGNRRMNYSAGTYHVLDAARMAAIGHGLDKLEQFLKEPPKKRRATRTYFGA